MIDEWKTLLSTMRDILGYHSIYKIGERINIIKRKINLSINLKMEKQQFSIRKRLKSFKYAINGLRVLFKYEHNSRIHLVALICAIVLGIFLDISNLEWLFIVIVSGFVFSTEIVNSAIEYISNFISPNYNEIIKKVKDLSAAAVLVSAITSLIVAFIIFIPKILNL